MESHAYHLSPCYSHWASDWTSVFTSVKCTYFVGFFPLNNQKWNSTQCLVSSKSSDTIPGVVNNSCLENPMDREALNQPHPEPLPSWSSCSHSLNQERRQSAGPEQTPPNQRHGTRQCGSTALPSRTKADGQNGCSKHLGYSHFCLSFRVSKKNGNPLPGWWVWLGLPSVIERLTRLVKSHPEVWLVRAGEV